MTHGERRFLSLLIPILSKRINPHLLLIVVVAFLLRFTLPGQTPPALNWDEASLGYNSYSVFKTGKDEWGRNLPLSFEAFGEYKLPGFIYTAVPFIALFGLDENSVRLPSRMAGVLSVLLVYWIVRKISSRQGIALLSALLFAVSPWHVFFSRMALEANLALLFFLLGTYFFVRSPQKPQALIFSSLFWGITIFTYNSARIFVPLFVLSLAVIYRHDLLKMRKYLVAALILFSVFLAAAGIMALSSDSSSRYYWVKILDQGAVNSLNEARANSALPDIIDRLIYNRVNYFVVNFARNYLSHFSLEFLFLKGGTNYQFSVPDTGIMYLVELPFLALGLLKALKEKSFRFIIAWLLLAPIPSAITREAPHVLRSIFMLGAIQIFTAFGLYIAWSWSREQTRLIKRGFPLGTIALFFVGFIFYFYQYFMIYPQKYSQSWQYGMKETVGFLQSVAGLDLADRRVYFTKRLGEPHIFYLFYSQYPPQRYQQNPTLIRYPMTNWVWVDQLDNLTFINDWDVEKRLDDLEKEAILIVSPENTPEGKQILKTIYYLDGSKALNVVQL